MNKLLEAGYAYRCFCSPERLESVRKTQREKGLPTSYDGKCREIPPASSPDNVQARKAM
ncbi:MAG: glutamate--tRNA ligase family protein [Candidatus Marinimicrobia bacterium]|nr:glutamate--tRNA ligase family protein [Candidatus Neomarinimicrobiota bacterium]